MADVHTMSFASGIPVSNTIANAISTTSSGRLNLILVWSWIRAVTHYERFCFIRFLVKLFVWPFVQNRFSILFLYSRLVLFFLFIHSVCFPLVLPPFNSLRFVIYRSTNSLFQFAHKPLFQSVSLSFVLSFSGSPIHDCNRVVSSICR